MFAPIKRRKFCSDRCSAAVHGNSGARNVRKKYGMSLGEWQRVRLMVFRRDEYRCYICHDLTDPSAEVNGDAYPNAEHVIPVSVGGETTMNNLRCAHRVCNMAKGNSLSH
jgi:5-methylcytosine-specific restriction endonuclease McrA